MINISPNGMRGFHNTVWHPDNTAIRWISQNFRPIQYHWHSVEKINRGQLRLGIFRNISLGRNFRFHAVFWWLDVAEILLDKRKHPQEKKYLRIRGSKKSLPLVIVHFAMMRHHMLFHFQFSGERGNTHAARVLLFPGNACTRHIRIVDSWMRHKVVPEIFFYWRNFFKNSFLPLGESFATGTALEWLFPRMDSHMTTKMAFTQHSKITNFAFDMPFSGMG